jgi:hypothetical protein
MMRQNFTRTVHVLALALGCAVIVAVPDGASATVAGTGPIHNRADGRCLDADLGRIGTNGTRIQLWDCNGWANQSWSYDPVTHTIRSLSNGRCLDADRGNLDRNGTRVQLWDCNGRTNQRWLYDRNSRTIYNLASGRCLDADLKGVGSNGTRVHLWDCNRWSNQKWKL